MHPDFLENFWLARARRHTGTNEDAEALDKLRPAVQRLSDLFTTARPDGAFPDYAADSALLIAYGLFFFPQSYARARLAFDLPVRFRQWCLAPRASGEPLRVLDLGSGTGPCGLAVAEMLREIGSSATEVVRESEPPTEPRRVVLTALDHSPSALGALKEICAQNEQGKNIACVTRVADLRRTAAALADLPPQDIIVAGFVANEIHGGNANALRDWLAMLGEKLATGGLLLVLEPALRDTATALHHAVAGAVATGRLHRWAPDVGQPPVPDEKHWQHEVRRWTPPESLAYLNRRLFRDIGVLKFSYTALGNVPPPALPPNAQTAWRLDSPLEPVKGRLICAAITSTGARVTLEIPTRDLSKSEAKHLAAEWEHGDIFTFAENAPPQAIGTSGTFRVAKTDALVPLYRPREMSYKKFQKKC